MSIIRKNKQNANFFLGYALFVGSLPYANVHEAMDESLERLGTTLPYVPDGELKDFIVHLGDRILQNPAHKARCSSC